MKRGKWFLLVLFLVLFSIFVSAEEKDCVYYFSGEGCPHCGATEIFMEQLVLKHPELEIHKFEIYYNKTSLITLQTFFDAFEVPLEKQGVPIVFLSTIYFVGDRPITEYLENAIISNKDESCPSLQKDEVLGVIGEKSPKHLIDTLTFGVVTGAAFVDSINPCAIAVLLILLGTLLAVKKRKKLLSAGLAFTFSIYIAYLFFGIGLLSVLALTGVSFYFYKSIGFLAILLGLFNIKDYFWYGKIFLMEIPQKWRPRLNKLLKGVTSPTGAFLVGFAVCLFELPCTGGPYLVILGLLAEKATKWAAMPLLLYYNLIFILPLIAITLIVYFSMKKIEEHGKEVKIDVRGDIERWRKRNIKLLHLIAGTIMVILGLMIVFFL
jgi:cytochrome c biogenesis protein CcdA/glutaredoxin